MPFVIESEEEKKSAFPVAQERNVLGTVANIKYYHQAKAWDSPLSFGIQAFIEYNGLILNDRHQADLIRVTKITGLDDSEVRDSRELRSGESGEFPYAAFYGGRNLVISGFIEAGNLAALETLKRNLKAAFATLEESQLKFRWFDVYDPFDDPNTILEYNPNASLANIPSGNYTPLVGNLGNLKVENGLLSWNTTSKVYFMRTSEKRTFCDVQMTMKCITGKFDFSYIGFLLCAQNSENYITTKYNVYNGLPFLSIVSVTNGESHTLVGENIPLGLIPKSGQNFWIRGIKEGNRLSVEYWTKIPSDLYFPDFYTECTLAGEDEENYGDGILSQVGIAGEMNTSWAFDEFKINSLYPGDIEFQARKISPVSIPDEQTSLSKFKRPFQIVMKSSDFRAQSSTAISRTIYPTSENVSPERGRSYSRKYPLTYSFLISKSLPIENNLLSVNNRGNVYIEPIIYLYGPGEDILIGNLTNGKFIEWLGDINENDYIKINCREKTIENSVGVNFLEPLASNSEWITLDPMWNDIYISGSGFVNKITKMSIIYRHGWM